MDTLRNVLGAFLLITLPAGIAYWLVIHPFVGFWRRFKPRVALIVSFLVMIVLGVIMAFQVPRLMGNHDYGTQPVLIGVGIALLGLSIWINRSCRIVLSLRTLAGVPELQGKGILPPTLLRQGIYNRIRHPRYVSIALQVIGMACVINYLATWICVAAGVAGLLLIVFFEERELEARFGERYRAYRREVPRFIPRLTRG
ncbi:MAG: isoprenylcysteine carboxylmethyltransferase family protein [Planctomycetota bacterium]